MTRFSSPAALLLAAAAVTLTPADAAAQLFRPFPFGAQSQQFHTRMYSGFYATPFGSIGFSYQRTSVASYSYPFFGGAGYPALYPNLPVGASVSPYFYGSAGGLGGPAYDRRSIDLQKAQRAARNDPGARRQAFDEWAVGRGGKAVPKEKIDRAPDAVRAALAAPREEDILSGKALNEAVAAILSMEAKGAQADAPFFPPETLAHAVFAGGHAADAANLFRESALTFPNSLRRPEFDAGRAAVEKEFAAAVGQLRAGKRIDAAVLDRLAKATTRLKDAYTARAGSDASFGESRAVAGFLDRLDGVAQAMKGTDDGLLVPAWYTVGGSAAAVARHVGRLKLQFAPAPPDDDGAYASLHRGLVTYLADLTQAAR